MTRTPGVLLAALLTVVVVGACASSTEPTEIPLTSARIAGTWTLAAQQVSNQAESPPPAGASFSFAVTNGQASVTADCNRCTGPAVVGSSTLTIGPVLACTRAFCASAPFDDSFVRILAGESTATIDGNTLALRSDRGVLRFRR